MSEQVAVERHTLQEAPGNDGRRSGSHRPAGRRLVLLVLLACAGVLALGAGSAQAFQSFSFQFGGTGAGAGQFNSPQGVAIHQSTGDVYVVDGANFRVEKFTPTSSAGGFDLAFGSGVNSGSGNANICTTDCQAGTQGTSPGAFTQPMFIAVDNSGGASDGDVYVGDPGDNTVSKFDSSGNLVTSWAGTGQLAGTATTFTSIDGIAVDSAGDLLVLDGGSNVWEFSGSSATLITNFNMGRGTNPAGLATNSAGDVFKVNGDGSVEETTNTGTVIGTVNEATNTTTEIALDPGSGDLYQDLGTSVDHYHFDASGNVVDAGGPCTVVESGSCVPTDSFGTGHVAAGTGLAYDSSQSTLYVADGSNEVEVFGPPEPGEPSVDSTTASNVGSTTATLNTQVNPFDNDTTCTFQYISDSAFMADGDTFGAGTQTAACNPADLGTGFNDVGATADISGLTINTTYDFQVTATNSAGTVTGPTEQFMTLGAATIDSLSSSNVGATSVELDAQINPLGTDTTCVFNIVDDSTFQNDGNAFGPGTTQLPCNPADLGAGSSDVAASAQATGLTPGTTYDYEVVATNSLGSVSEAAQVQTTPPLVIDSELATHVSQTTATLTANVNPDGVDTKVQFQFETDATFQASLPGNRFQNATTVPAGGIDIGSGTSDVAASVDLVGLTPGTTYHFRVIGSNAAGSEQGAAKSFETSAGAPTTGLPDNRGYEMVTPVNKADGEIFSNELISGDQSALSGNSVAYVSLTSFPGSTGPGVNYIATRGANGWTTKTMLPPQAAGDTLELPGYAFFSSDLSSAVLANGDSDSGGGQDNPPIVPGEPRGPLNLFLRNNTTGAFQLVNVTPASATAADAHFDNASPDGSTVVFDEPAALTAGASPTGPNLFVYDSATHSLKLLGVGAGLGSSGSSREVNAVSNDGSKIFFTDSSGDLEVFENGSATQVVPTTNSASPSYQEALTDGSAVFFTDDASAGLPNTTAGSGANLYEFDTANGEVTNLTANQADATVDGVLGVGGTAGNSFEYFVAEGAFGGAPGSAAGSENLYVVHNGAAAKFIATLSASDGSDWNGQYTARVTPDGTHLAFDSTNPLTGFDNTDANTANADTEIFLYDATTNKLACASCSPAGNQPIGSSQLDPVQSGLLSGGNTYLSHQLSDDGSRLFFDSNGALVQNDNNSVQDVYEFENGQDHLISTGTSSSNSIFVDASASGNDVFFATRDQLVPQDTDGGNDLYDARVNGGFPVSAPNPPCTGDGCKPPTTAPPAPPVTATVTFAGPSNPAPKSSKKTKPKAKVRFSTKAMKGFRFSISVRVPADGKVKVWGAGLKTLNKSVNGGHSYKLTVALNGAQRKALRKKHKRRMRLTVHIDYKAATGQSSTAIVPVTVQA